MDLDQKAVEKYIAENPAENPLEQFKKSPAVSKKYKCNQAYTFSWDSKKAGTEGKNELFGSILSMVDDFGFATKRDQFPILLTEKIETKDSEIEYILRHPDQKDFVIKQTKNTYRYIVWFKAANSKGKRQMKGTLFCRLEQRVGQDWILKQDKNEQFYMPIKFEDMMTQFQELAVTDS